MSYIRNNDYSEERIRPKLLSNYFEQMTNYLRLQNPTSTLEEIEQFVKKIIKDKFKAPTVTAVVHKTEGNSEVISIPLDKYVNTVIKDNNLSPSGTSYMLISRRESFLRRSIENKIAARNKFKKLYLEFESQGKKRESQYYNTNQANAKIFNNAITGGMKINQFILGCKAGFNAITSVGRMCVKQGYSFIERAVNGNIYLPSTEAAISYILNHSNYVHEDFENVAKEYQLYIPTTDEVLEYILNSVHNYVNTPDTPTLRNLIDGLSSNQKAYVFYVGCLKNLCIHNDEMMRTWIDSCFIQDSIDPSLYSDIDVGEVKEFNNDVISCMLSTNYRRLGENPSKPGKWNSIKDALKNNPDGVKEFIYVCKNFVSNFEKYLPLLKVILQVNTTFSKLTLQHQMARYTVPLSDTDSNIFSTQELVRWKRRKLDFSQESYEMNAMVTLLLSQSLEHVFARLSAGFGCEGKDVFRISMKNEFLYPVLISTALAKHYMAIATMQEGALLTVPRKDIKGVNLRSSVFPKLIRDSFESFVVDLFAKIEEGKPIRAASILDHVAKLEQTVFNSVNDREAVYLTTTSIKLKEDYADADGSSYFYYELWKDVFSEDFGEMVIPNKCYKIPLIGGKKFIKSDLFQVDIKNKHPKIYERLNAYIEKYPNRDISYFLVPPFKGKVQPFFVDIIDSRSHISQVMTPYYHLLRGLGIGTVDNRANALVSDFYDPSTALIS